MIKGCMSSDPMHLYSMEKEAGDNCRSVTKESLSKRTEEKLCHDPHVFQHATERTITRFCALRIRKWTALLEIVVAMSMLSSAFKKTAILLALKGRGGRKEEA